MCWLTWCFELTNQNICSRGPQFGSTLSGWATWMFKNLNLNWCGPTIDLIHPNSTGLGDQIRSCLVHRSFTLITPFQKVQKPALGLLGLTSAQKVQEALGPHRHGLHFLQRHSCGQAFSLRCFIRHHGALFRAASHGFGGQLGKLREPILDAEVWVQESAETGIPISPIMIHGLKWKSDWLRSWNPWNWNSWNIIPRYPKQRVLLHNVPVPGFYVISRGTIPSSQHSLWLY